MAVFRRTRTAIAITETIVIMRMIAIRTPTETPNVRPLIANDLESPVIPTVAA